MTGPTVYPGALDSFPTVLSTTLENDAGFEHDLIHDWEMTAIAALQALVGTAPAGTRPIIQQLISIGSQIANLRSAANEARINIDALQQTPAFDDSKLFSLQARVDALASALAVLQTTSATGGGTTDPLAITLTAQVFGS